MLVYCVAQTLATECNVTLIPDDEGYSHNCAHMHVDTNCTQTCEAGFFDNNRENTENTAVAGEYSCPSGVFAGRILQCFRVVCPIRNNEYGYVIAITNRPGLYEDVIPVTCAEGFQGDPPSMVCRSDGEWSKLEGCEVKRKTIGFYLWQLFAKNSHFLGQVFIGRYAQ
jgi:hypothetical protein